jgi:predicted ATPase
MLTRLKISGFKNLKSVDLRFGFFTCIAGQNGVGKSNLFDAIKFLSDLASMPIANAAGLVRGLNSKTTSFASLFSAIENGGAGAEMEFLVEAVVPSTVVDDYSQAVDVTSTCLEYKLGLRLIKGDSKKGMGDRIEITSEHLKPRTKSAVSTDWKFADKELALKHVRGKRTNPFIETKEDQGITKIFLRSDDGNDRRGAPLRVPLTTPRTVLSGVDSEAHASHLAMRREMQSWKLLQLEPSALREPDTFNSDSQVSHRGEHLPAALHRIKLNADVAADLSKLIRGVQSVDVIDNDLLQLRTLSVTFNNQSFPASALSDGTLRFLALSVLSCDPDANGLICMEEPENGIHPTKIPEMVELVKNLSYSNSGEEFDSAESASLRQVLINTHSPLVVAEIVADDILFAQAWQRGGFRGVEYLPIKDTWRAKADEHCVQTGEVLSFLSGASAHESKAVVGKRVKELFASVNQSTLAF